MRLVHGKFVFEHQKRAWSLFMMATRAKFAFKLNENARLRHFCYLRARIIENLSKTQINYILRPYGRKKNKQ